MNKVVNLSLTQKDIPVIIHYVQYSTKLPIEFHVRDYSMPGGAAARFYLKKPSGFEVYNECILDGNVITLKPTAQTFAESGRQIGQLQIVSDEDILVSFILNFDIERNIISESAIPSSNEFGVLDELIKEAQKAVADSSEAASAANSAAENANNAAREADAAAQVATNAAGEANTAAEEANTARDVANTATSAANTAAGSANSAASAANQAAENAQEIIDTANDRLLPSDTPAENDMLLVTAAGVAWGKVIYPSKVTVPATAGSLMVGSSDYTITNAEYDELLNLLGGEAIRLIDWIYPVGHVITTVNPSYDPNKIFKTHTWVRFAEGQTLVGVNESDADFNVAERTGGEKRHKLTLNEMPKHSHNVSINDDSSNRLYYTNSNATLSNGQAIITLTANTTPLVAESNGGGADHNNLPPYSTVYFWKRTA